MSNFGSPSTGDRRGGVTHIVVLQSDDRPFGLVVDSIHDTRGNRGQAAADRI